MNRVGCCLLAIAAALPAGCGGEEERGGGEPEAPGAPVPVETESAGAEPDAGIAAICDTITNSFRCARTVERRRLPRAEGALRRGDTLGLVLATGDTARLVDVADPPERVVHYSYQDRWLSAAGPGYFVIQTQYYEGSQHLLVEDSTGAHTLLPDRPLRAPDGERFAVLSLDLEAGYGPNVLQLWSLGGSGPELEWETEPERWGPVDGRWVDAGTLRFTRRGFCEEGSDPGRGYCDREATVRRVDGEWTVEVGGPAPESSGA